jgi:bifunctional non-homologous end joining protein LigD
MPWVSRRKARDGEVTFWAFDLLAINGKDLRDRPLTSRQARLREAIADLDCPPVVASETFDDGAALLRAAEKHTLEGVVSKRRNTAYRSGDCRDWRKVKTTIWREQNRERWKLFDNGRY